jgi:erythritol transport system ATP-binding protein
VTDPVDVVIEARNVSKRYGGVHALQDVTFRARRGAVNVLVGENGAGKSTLMKLLSGTEEPSDGEILVDGVVTRIATPREAKAAGIGIIHQELSLFPNLSIAENMFAGRELGRAGFVDFGSERERAREVLARLKQDVDVDTLVGDLAIGVQQMVEIGRALTEDVRILIMDEPTSALSNAEVDVLFDVLEDLRRNDVTIIYISHKLEEFQRIGDHVFVLRDGRLVAEADMDQIDTGWIVRTMVGRSEQELYARTPVQPGDVVLDVRGLTVPGETRDVVVDADLTLRKGEIVGIYGLMGAGRTELLEAIFGLRASSAGSVTLDGEVLSGENVTQRLAAGLAMVPEDRQRAGLVQTTTVSENITLSSLKSLVRGLLVSRRAATKVATAKVDELSIKTPSLGSNIMSLSGGNQQKVVIARALLTDPKVLLLDEPTRGVDVGAKAEIFALMERFAGEGLGVVFASSELAEVRGMADRVLVMASGRITAELSGATLVDEELVAASAPSSTAGATS